MKGADSRPRIHLWPCERGYRASVGATGYQSRPFDTAGEALDGILPVINPVATKGGVVVIMEAIDHG